jgi:hypothetical protein
VPTSTTTEETKMKIMTGSSFMSVIDRLHHLSIEEAIIIQAALATMINLEKARMETA